MSEGIRLGHPMDIENERRAIIFHEKLAALKDGLNSKDCWQLAIDAAEASHWLWMAGQRIQQPDHWAEIQARDQITFRAIGRDERGGTIVINQAKSEQILELAMSDPHAHDALIVFCAYAIAGKALRDTDDTVFVLDQALKDWIFEVLVNGKGRPRTKKKTNYDTRIINEAIACTVKSLNDQGLPIYKSKATKISTNACDAVAEISGHVLNRRFIDGKRVNDIFYESDYAKVD